MHRAAGRYGGKRASRTAKPCGPDRRVLRSSRAKMRQAQPGQLASSIREATGAIVPRSPGRSRHKPSTHRAGKAGRSAAPVCRCAAFFRVPRTADRGCQAGTRPSLRLLGSKRAKETAKLGRNQPREREAVSTIQMRIGDRHPDPKTPSLRAPRSNPESSRGTILDCFVARAPRNDAEESA